MGQIGSGIALDNGWGPRRCEAIISANDDIDDRCFIEPQWVML